MWHIGKVELANRIVAAPLAGISNPVYRQIAHDYGAGLTVSEMISDKALHYQNAKTFDMCRTFPTEHPVSLQLFGSDPITMGEASRYLTEHTDCDIIDINMGCPVTKVLKAHSGSWLLNHPDLAYDIVRTVKDNTDRPVTVKIRAGWDKEHIVCDTFAKKMEEAGADAIAVHGRTRSQLYTGVSNNQYIKMVKDAVRIPVIGNGDIRTVEDVHRMYAETGCDAIMIGRGLMGRPFFIQEILADEKGLPYQEPSYEERIDLCYDYAQKLCAYEEEYTGIHMMRSMAGWYLSGMPYAAQCKAQLTTVNCLQDMLDILNAYRQRISQCGQ